MVAPPPTVQDNSVASYEVIAYPANGQSVDQQGRDRYECHGWAVGQSGFDPATATLPVGAEATERYRRALGACLAGRCYSVNSRCGQMAWSVQPNCCDLACSARTAATNVCIAEEATRLRRLIRP